MKLVYSLKLEDAVKFNQDHLESIPEMKRKLSIMRNVWAFTPLVAISAIMFVEQATPSKTAIVISLVAFCVSTPIYFLQPVFFRWSTSRQLRKIYSEPQNQALLGEHEMEIVGNELVERSGTTENRFQLKSIEKVLTSGDHTYVYTSGAQAHIVPKVRVTEGDYDAFVRKLRKKTKQGLD
jgi:hypothetical protein